MNSNAGAKGPVRTIAVVLGDNDFGATFQPLLESIARAIVWNVEPSREVLEKAIRAGVEFHYLAFQHGRHFGEPGYGSVEDTVSYLRTMSVLFDEEAESDIARHDHDRGAGYLETATGQVYVY